MKTFLQALWKSRANVLFVVGLLSLLVVIGIQVGVDTVTGLLVTVCMGCIMYAWRLQANAIPARSVPTLEGATSQSDLETFKTVMVDQLNKQAERIERQQRKLASEWIAFYEWQEFPEPIDLADHDSQRDAHSTKKKDEQVKKILEDESRRLFNRILANSYSQDGRFDYVVLRDEMYELAQRIAKVYRPDARTPLLDTSFEQMARAISRASLHLLLVFDQLPLDIKTYSIANIYDYIRRGVSYYGAYQKAAPLLSYLSRGLSVGRMVSSTNPVTFGLWWGATELGRIGATQVVKQYANQQALVLLHEIVQVVGYEVATLYGGDLRTYDPNFCYAVELTNLMGKFPVSRDGLKHALEQIGRLPLKHEYDRIYLYRCLASHQTPGKNITNPKLLTISEREQIARHLEEAVKKVIHGATPDRVDAWRKDFEQRYQMKMSLATTSTATHPAAQNPTNQKEYEATRSLAEFLLTIQPLDVEDLPALLGSTNLWSRLSLQEHSRLAQELRRRDHIEFTPPDLDPVDPLLPVYLHDLARLVVTVLPYSIELEFTLVEIGGYFRKPTEEMLKLIGQVCQEELAKTLIPEAPTRKPNVAASRASRLLQDETGAASYIYESIGCSALKRYGKLALVGNARGLFVISEENPELLWRSNASVAMRQTLGYFASEVILIGGEWMVDIASEDAASIVVTSPLTAKAAPYFAALLTAFSGKVKIQP